MNSYATDGKCHNAQPGTFGHECGKPATWIGTKSSGFRCGFCDECKEHGAEARLCRQWERVAPVRKPGPHHNALLAWDKRASAGYLPGWFIGSEGENGEHLRDTSGWPYSLYRKADPLCAGTPDLCLCTGIQMLDDAQALANLLNFR
jgi:hypothetical protein